MHLPIRLILFALLSSASTAILAAESGVELSGHAADETPPDRWQLLGKDNKPVATVREKWGFAPLPPGDYRLVIRPSGYSAKEIEWGDVKVEAGKAVKVQVNSGVEVAGHDKDAAVLHFWHVERGGDRDKQRVASVYQRWGFTPLPPGNYRLVILPGGYASRELTWTTFTVKPGEIAKLKVDSGVEVTGRDGDDKVLHYWHAYGQDAKTPVASVYERWGFTPLPPGDYRLVILPGGYSARSLDWGKVTVKAQEVTKARIDSGIELSGRGADEPVLHYWHVYGQDAKEPVASVYQRWGFTPLRPGSYRISLLPAGYSAKALDWGSVEVAAQKTSRASIDSGVELVSSIKDAPLPDYWFVIDPKQRDPLASVYQRWGFTPMIPGEYRVAVRPAGFAAVQLDWGTLKVERGKTAKLDLSSGVAVTGRSPQDEPPQYWFLQDPKAAKPAAAVYQRWGVVLVPPGQYAFSLLPGDFGAVKLPWSTFNVESGKSVAIGINSGVELLPAKAGDTPPEWWHVNTSDDAAAIANVYQRWGFAPLPPGKYRLRLTPPDKVTPQTPGKEMDVLPGKVVPVRIDELAPLKPIRSTAPSGGMIVRPTGGDTVVELAWDVPKGLKIKGYRVYRAGAARPIHGPAPITQPRFTDLGLTNGRTYEYTIKAILEDGTEWAGYQPITATPERR